MDRSDVPITLMGVPAVCSGYINVVAMFGQKESEGIHLVQVVRVTRRCGSEKYLKSKKFLERYSGVEHIPVRTSLEFRLLFRDAAFPECYKVEPECVYSFASAEEVSSNTKASNFAHLSTRAATSFSPHEDDDDSHVDPATVVHPFTLASRVDGCVRTDRVLAARDQKAETPALVMRALGIESHNQTTTPPTANASSGVLTQDESIPLVALANKSGPTPKASSAGKQHSNATVSASPKAAPPTKRVPAPAEQPKATVTSPAAPAVAASPKQPAKRSAARASPPAPVEAPSPVRAVPSKSPPQSSPIEPKQTSKQRRKEAKAQLKIEKNARKYSKKLEKQMRQEAKLASKTAAKEAKVSPKTDTPTPRRQTKRQAASSQNSTPTVSQDAVSQEPLTFPDSVPSIMLERRYDPSEILKSATPSQEMARHVLTSLDNGPSPQPSKPARQSQKRPTESTGSANSVPSSQQLKAPPQMKQLGDVTSGGVTPAVSQPLFPTSQQSPSQALSELFDLSPNTTNKINVRTHKPPIIVPVSASPSASVLRGNSTSQFEVPSSQPPLPEVRAVSPPVHVSKVVAQQQPASKPRVVITQRTVKGHRRARSLSSSSSEDLPIYRAPVAAAPAKAASSERPFRPEPSNPSRPAAAAAAPIVKSSGDRNKAALLPSPSDVSGGIVMSSDDGGLLGDGLMLPPSNAPEKEPHDDSSDYAAGHRHKTRERMLGLKYGGGSGGVDSSDIGGESGSLVPAPRANLPTMRASRPSPTATTQPPPNSSSVTASNVKPAPRPTIPPPQSPALSFSQIPTRIGVVAPQRALSESTEDSSTVTDDSD